MAGRWTSSSVNVYVDDFDGASLAGFQRSAYQGVGSAPVSAADNSLQLAAEGLNAVVTIGGYTGRHYQLQLTPEIELSNWQNIGAPVPGAGENGVPVLIRLVHTNGFSGPSAFYRVLVE